MLFVKTCVDYLFIEADRIANAVLVGAVEGILQDLVALGEE